MGNCVSAYGTSQPPKPKATLDVGPVPNTSALELEDLLRMGIAEAQTATVARAKRERLQHLHTARGLLTAALRRCGQRDPDLCAHLLAVLLKLGEDARAVQGLMAECGSGADEAPAAAAAGAAGNGRGSAPSPPAAGEPLSDNSSENAEAGVRLWEYDEMKEGLLDESGDDGASPAASAGAAVLSVELAAESTSPTDVLETPVRLRTSARRAAGTATPSRTSRSPSPHLRSGHAYTRSRSSSPRSRVPPLSTVQESDDGAGSAAGASVAGGMQTAQEAESPRSSKGASGADAKSAPSLPAPGCQEGQEPAEAPETRRPLESILGRLGRSRGSSDSKVSSAGAGQAMQESPEAQDASEVRGPLEGILGRLGRSRSFSHAPAHEPADEQHANDERNVPVEAVAADSGSSPQAPAQASAAWSPHAQQATEDAPVGAQPQHLLGDSAGGTGDTRESLKESIARLARCVQPQQAGSAHLGAKRRHARSSGSMDSSEAPSAPSQHAGMKQGGGQPSRQSSSSGSQGTVSDSESSSAPARTLGAAREPQLAKACACGNVFLDDSVFCRKCGKKRPEASAAPASRGRRDESPGRQAEGQEPRGPAEALRAPRLVATPGLEKASPCLEAAVRNPLSHAELLFGGPALAKGSLTPKCCAASPWMGSCTSLEDFSISASVAPSIPPSATTSAAPSPFCGGAVQRPELAPPAAAAIGAADVVSVRVLNGVSGEEEVRFAVPVHASFSQQHFLSMLDRLCQRQTGHALSALNWLSQAQPGDRFQRRKCDVCMVEELFADNRQKKGTTVLLLCTVPVRPPSELAASKVRLKNLAPAQVSCRSGLEPVRLQLHTSPLEASHNYSVAFTHQWSSMTYVAEAALLPSQRGVELTVPRQMLLVSQSTEGLYDVHLVIDSALRSENRRTLTVGSAESELSSSCASHSCSASSFVPIRQSA